VYLVDTNVWLERLLDQSRSEEVRRFLEQTPTDRLFVTDFALHSIGVVLQRLDRLVVFGRFVQDVFLEGAVGLTRLGPEDMERLVAVAERCRLDFDDAYQYLAAEKHNLAIVSFDSDFDRTDLGRRTPLEALEA
jgi:predicted nucleic acid-binding protein